MLKVDLLAYTPNPEEVIASCAKLCYSQVGVEDILKKLNKEEIDKFLDTLNSLGHHSPFEHTVFSFAVEGVSRALTHQLVRHRIASYSQQSQRYVRESSFDYIIPVDIEANEKAKMRFIKHMEDSQNAYDEIVETLMEEYLSSVEVVSKKAYLAFEKKAIENARYVFPNAIETKIVVTMNVRALMNFFEKRCCNRAQDEIRNLADKMLEEVTKVAPNLFKYSGAPCAYGKCPEGSMSCGNPRKR